MAERRVAVRFSAEIQGFKQAMNEAAEATRKAKKASEEAGKTADTALGKIVESATQHKEDWDNVGQAALGFGTATVAGLGLATKAAINWEAAWAGVTKTVDGSPEEMAALEEELRGLAKTLPATHEEIAGVAEAAGQLGVAREDVSGFTKTMIDLSETTNLTADEAATSIAQISNVMGTMDREGSAGVQRFGAALVALGNDGASTEAEIVAMASRLTGAMKLVGASESDLLAMANAMASVGIEAQLGGGVMSRVMQRMYGDVMEGGEGLQNLADVAGVSAEEFATAFENDPVRATDMMIKGLNGVKESGGNVMETMDELGIKGTEETSVMLRLAGAGDLLTDSLDLGAEAWRNNTALADEAAKRYETTEAKIQIAWNTIKDAAIDAGAVILPVVAGVAETVADMAEWFSNLPEPVQGALTLLTGVAGSAALASGAFLTLTPRIIETVTSFRNLRSDGVKIPGVVGKVTKAVGGLAVAYTAAATAAALLADAQNGDRTKTSVEGFNNALSGMAENAPAARKALDGMFNGVLDENMISGKVGVVNDLDDALNRVFNPSKMNAALDWGGTLIGQEASTGMRAAKDALGDLDRSMASLAESGSAEDAAAAFQEVNRQAAAAEIPLSELMTMFPEYADVIKATATENGNTQLSYEDLVAAMSGTGPAAITAAEGAGEAKETIADVGTAAEQAAEQADDLVESLLAMNNVNLSAADAQLQFDQAIADAAENLGNAGAGVDYLNEKTGEFNQTAADNLEMLNGIASQGNSVAQTVYDQTGSYDEFRESLERSRTSLYETAKAYFPTEEAAWAYVDSVLAIPDEVKTVVDITDNNTAEGVRDNVLLLHDAIQATPDKTVIINEPMSPEIRKKLEDLGYTVETLPDGTIQVTQNGAEPTKQQIQDVANGPYGATVNADAETSAAEAELNHVARSRTSSIFMTTYQSVVKTGGQSAGNSYLDNSGMGGPGGYTGGLVSDLMGFAGGGRVPGAPPSDPRKDNVLALVNGKPLKVRSREWIINEEQSERNDKWLRAINSGLNLDDYLGAAPGRANGGRAGREYMAPPAYASGSAGPVTAALAAEDRALLRAVVDRPVQVESRLAIGDRDAGHIVSRGQVANKRMGGR